MSMLHSIQYGCELGSILAVFGAQQNGAVPSQYHQRCPKLMHLADVVGRAIAATRIAPVTLMMIFALFEEMEVRLGGLVKLMWYCHQLKMGLTYADETAFSYMGT